jgi:hypothetical protein
MTTMAKRSGPGTSRWEVSFGFFGGALAWLAHLLGASLVSEWGCFAGWGRQQWLGISSIAWVILILSVMTLLIALAATWVAFRSGRTARADISRPPSSGDTQSFLAQTSLQANGLFALIIVAESIPILFYLTEC